MRIASAKTRAFLWWSTAAIVVSLAVARVSVWVQSHFAPLVLYPLLIGALLGALLCGLLEVARFNQLPAAAVATVVVALVAAAAEHGFFYLDYRGALTQKALENRLPIDELPQPSFTEYMRAQAETDRVQVPLWLGHAGLMATAAVGMVVWYLRSRAAKDHLDRTQFDGDRPASPSTDTIADEPGNPHSARS